MNEDYSRFDYSEEYAKYILKHDLWDYEKNKLKKIVRNKLKTIKMPDGTLTQVNVGFTTKPIRMSRCRRCFKLLTGKQREYCSLLCKQDIKELEKRFKELKKKNPEITGIMWNEDKDFEKSEWRDIKGIFHTNGKYIEKKNVITKKHHRGKQPRKLKNESNDFSKGKDF